MKLSRETIQTTLAAWETAWNRHDIGQVMDLFHEEVVFEHWTGTRIEGKKALKEAWQPWFENHGDFRFTTEDLFVDEADQKALYRWILEWPSYEKGVEGKHEKRRGVDVIHFNDGRIIQKLTYSKTVIEIDGSRIRLAAKPA